MTDIGPLDASVLPAGIRSRFVDGINGLRVHAGGRGLKPSMRAAAARLPEIAIPGGR